MITWITSSSVLLLMLIFLRYLLRGKLSPGLQYALWLAALLRLLIPGAVFTSPASLANLTEQTAIVQRSEMLQGIETLNFREDGVIAGYQRSDFLRDMPVVLAENASHEDYDRFSAALTLRRVLISVWLWGIVSVGGAFVLSNLRFSRQLRQARRELEVQDSPLPVYVCAGIKTPCLFGLLQPAVYVTPSAAGDEAGLRHVLAHETAHYRHGDNLWAALRGVCLALHWYNPLVWWAAGLSRRDAELACDALALRRLGDDERAAYGRTLISLTVPRSGRFDMLSCATTMTGGQSALRERVAQITRQPRTRLLALILALLAIAAAGVCLFSGARKDTLQGEVRKVGQESFLFWIDPNEEFPNGRMAAVDPPGSGAMPELAPGDRVEVTFFTGRQDYITSISPVIIQKAASVRVLSRGSGELNLQAVILEDPSPAVAELVYSDERSSVLFGISNGTDANWKWTFLSLSEAAALRIFGEEGRLRFAGSGLFGLDDITAEGLFDTEGVAQSMVIQGWSGIRGDKAAFQISMYRQDSRLMHGAPSTPEHVAKCRVFDTEVETCWTAPDPDSANAGYSVHFAVNGLEVRCMTTVTDYRNHEQARRLLDHIVWQCLNPDNVLTLDDISTKDAKQFPVSLF